MARLWNLGLAPLAVSALGTFLFLVVLQQSPGTTSLAFQTFPNDDHCVEEQLLCDASFDYSRLMKSNPVAAALWSPCRVELPSAGGTAHVLPIDGGAQEAFMVRVCTSAGAMSVRVIHQNQQACTVQGASTLEALGLSRTEAVKDYIEVLLDGPERRLQRMKYASVITSPSAVYNASHACEYRLQLPIYVPGTYRVQVMVVHSGIDLAGIEPYRNYALWDRVHLLSARTLNQVAPYVPTQETVAWQSAGGWMRTSGTCSPDLHSAQAFVTQEWNIDSYRCPANGTASFAWVPLTEHVLRETPSNVMVVPRKDYRPLNPQEAMACARALAPKHKATYPKLVLFGDSLMRQTFNALALAIGMEHVAAIKEFKSLMESQDWGGSSIGLDFSFQWAARPNEGRSTCKQAYPWTKTVYVVRHVLIHPCRSSPSHTHSESFA